MREGLEVLLYHPVHDLCLVIALQMVGKDHPQLSSIVLK